MKTSRRKAMFAKLKKHSGNALSGDFIYSKEELKQVKKLTDEK